MTNNTESGNLDFISSAVLLESKKVVVRTHSLPENNIKSRGNLNDYQKSSGINQQDFFYKIMLAVLTCKQEKVKARSYLVIESSIDKVSNAAANMLSWSKA